MKVFMESFFLIKPLENPLEPASAWHCGKSTLGKVKNFRLAKLFAEIWIKIFLNDCDDIELWGNLKWKSFGCSTCSEFSVVFLQLNFEGKLKKKTKSWRSLHIFLGFEPRPLGFKALKPHGFLYNLLMKQIKIKNWNKCKNTQNINSNFLINLHNSLNILIHKKPLTDKK